MRASDAARGAIRQLSTDGAGRRLAIVRLRHADYRADRWWSWCDLPIVLPADAPPLALADEVLLVLAGVAEASRQADAPGHYSCRLHPASEGPQLPPERVEDRVYCGLIERGEPPRGGALILHLGSSITCYLELEGEGPFPPASLDHGEWSEFILAEPLGVASLQRLEKRS